MAAGHRRKPKPEPKVYQYEAGLVVPYEPGDPLPVVEGWETPYRGTVDADPDVDTNYTRGAFPADLEGELYELAKRRLYRRLQNPVLEKEVKTATIAAIVRDLGRLQLAREKPQGDPLAGAKKINVLALVNGLPTPRQLEVLQQALQGADEPEPILEAIRELEATNGVGEVSGAGGFAAASE